MSAPCACGCGRPAGVDSRGRPRRFVELSHVLRHENYMRQPGAVNPFKGRTHTAETRAVLSEKAKVPKPWIRGERNGMHGRKGAASPNWKGGATPDRQRVYASSEWREARRLVRQRDGSHCVECGSAQNVHIHHIKPFATHPDLRVDVENLITLCRDCHAAAHRKGVMP